MQSAANGIHDFDELVHEPARLIILVVLSQVEEADFTFLLSMTGLSKGNLSGHISRLEGEGLVAAEKTFVKKRPKTTIKLKSEGHKRLEAHWDYLETLRGSTVARSLH